MFLYPVLIGEFDVHAWHDTPRQTQNPADVFAKFFLFIFNPLLALLRYNVLYLCVLAIEHCQCTSYSLCATFRVDVCCVVFKSPIGAALSFTGISSQCLTYPREAGGPVGFLVPKSAKYRCSRATCEWSHTGVCALRSARIAVKSRHLLRVGQSSYYTNAIYDLCIYCNVDHTLRGWWDGPACVMRLWTRTVRDSKPPTAHQEKT